MDGRLGNPTPQPSPPARGIWGPRFTLPSHLDVIAEDSIPLLKYRTDCRMVQARKMRKTKPTGGVTFHERPGREDMPDDNFQYSPNPHIDLRPPPSVLASLTRHFPNSAGILGLHQRINCSPFAPFRYSPSGSSSPPPYPAPATVPITQRLPTPLTGHH